MPHPVDSAPSNGYGVPGAPAYSGAIPGGLPPEMLAATSGGPPIGRLLRRKWFLLLLGIGAGLGAGYYYDTVQEPTFESVAEVAVSYRQPRIPVGDSGEGESTRRRDVLGEYLHRMLSPPLIIRAINERQLMELPRFKGGSPPVGAIMQGLEGARIPETLILRPTYQGKSPEEARAVLDAIVKTFIASIEEEERSVSQEALELITEVDETVDKELAKAQTAYREFEETSPLVRGADGKPLNPYASDLVQIDALRDQLRLELTTLSAEIKAIREALRSGGRREALTLMADLSRQRANDGAEAAEKTFEEKNFELLLLLDEVRDRYGENHPTRKRVEKRYEAVRKLMADRAGVEPGKPGDEARSFLDLFVDSREERAAVLRTQIADLDQQYA
ncbi:MAG: hypothetical protein AAF907_10245, partial [Planctomycetota bacterium]